MDKEDSGRSRNGCKQWAYSTTQAVKIKCCEETNVMKSKESEAMSIK